MNTSPSPNAETGPSSRPPQPPSPTPLPGPALSPTPLQHTNFNHLYADVFWFGVLAGSTAAFIAVYAARLGASSFQVGLLTGGPALVSLFFSLPAGHWLEKRSLTRATYWTSVLHRAAYLVMVPLPLLFSFEGQVWLLLALALGMSVPGVGLAIAFNAMFADVVAPEWRAQVVGRRNALLAISITATSLLSGRLLDQLPFPSNYVVLFSVGALGAGLSSYHLKQVIAPAQAPPRVARPLADAARPGLLRYVDALRQTPGLRFLARSHDKPLLRLDLLRGPFGPVLTAYLLFYTFQYLAIPLFPLFFVNELHLTDGQISLGNALFHGMMLLGSLGLQPISARFSHRKVFAASALVFGAYPLLLGFAHEPTLYLIASAIGGGIWALANGGMVNFLMERVPANDRPAHMALHHLVLNLSVLAGSLIGPALADVFGLREMILLSAGLRLLGGLLIAILG